MILCVQEVVNHFIQQLTSWTYSRKARKKSRTKFQRKHENLVLFFSCWGNTNVNQSLVRNDQRRQFSLIYLNRPFSSLPSPPLHYYVRLGGCRGGPTFRGLFCRAFFPKMKSSTWSRAAGPSWLRQTFRRVLQFSSRTHSSHSLKRQEHI